MGKFLDVHDLNRIQRAHYDVAESFSGDFRRQDFFRKYKQMFPNHNADGSILPTDFCWNNNQEARNNFPSFMEIVERGVYRFVGLQEGEQKKAQRRA